MITLWIQTASGAAIDLLDPDPWAITLPDVAHSLAHINRYTGHAGRYSVAQHSVIMAQRLRDEGHGAGTQRSALLHDAHEMIVGDVSSPLKRAMTALGGEVFATLEARAAAAAAIRFSVARELPAAVKVADLRMCATEARDLLGPAPLPWVLGVEPYEVRIRRWTEDQAEVAFLAEADRLGIA